MRVPFFLFHILSILVFSYLISGIFSPAIAEKPIFLTPHTTKENKEKLKKTQKIPIFINKNTNISRKNAQFYNLNRTSSVFRNDLSVYRGLKGLNLTKLTSYGGEPDNIDEFLKLSAARRLPTVKAIIEMQKQSSGPPPLPVIEPTLIKPVMTLGEDPLDMNGHKKSNKKKVKAVYKPAEKKRILPWRIFGN